MSYFEDEIAHAVVLALFVPLIISCGGNSGSQATSLIIRSLALRELQLRDWWRVALREMLSRPRAGRASSGASASLRIVALAAGRATLYGAALPAGGHHRRPQPDRRRDSSAPSCGSMLPFLLRRLGFDPGDRSAPVRGHAGRRHRAGHLLHRGEPDPPRHAALMTGDEHGAPGPVHDWALLLLGRKRNHVLTLEEVQRYGRDSFGDADHVSPDGLRPPSGTGGGSSPRSNRGGVHPRRARRRHRPGGRPKGGAALTGSADRGARPLRRLVQHAALDPAARAGLGGPGLRAGPDGVRARRPQPRPPGPTD